VLAGHEVILDGELIAGQGRARDFYQVAPTIAASTRRPGQPLRLAIFGLPWLDGDLCRTGPTPNAGPCWKGSPCADHAGRRQTHPQLRGRT
jgi:ATP-dependent DNA ligase